MADLIDARLVNDISPLKNLIAPRQDTSRLKYDPDRQAIILENIDDAKYALENGGVSFEMKGASAVITTIQTERGRNLTTYWGKLIEGIDCFIDGEKLPAGTQVVMIEMDREFYITDGPFWANAKDGTRASHFAVNSGAPGDFLMAKKGDNSRVFRVAREWALSAVELDKKG